jgi:outer membrane protein OmpA-like peptidoglycan-associated protein
MPVAPRPAAALAWIAAAVCLTGCLTPHAKPQTSQAVLDARAHRDVPVEAACPPATLAQVSPVQLGFGFDEAKPDSPLLADLTTAARWLACHPAVPVAIKPDGDGHGAPADQDRLARARGEVAQSFLISHRVAAARIRILDRGAAAPGGDVFLVRAEGRRW